MSFTSASSSSRCRLLKPVTSTTMDAIEKDRSKVAKLSASAWLCVGSCLLIVSLALNQLGLDLKWCFVPFGVVIVSLLVFTSLRYRLRIFYETLPRDVRGVWVLIRLWMTIRTTVRNNLTVIEHFKNMVHKYQDKACLINEDRSWSFKQMDEYSNRVANVFHAAGYKHGDVVALFMESCPEFVCIWLGLAKLGVVTALVNNHIRLQPLVHAVTAADAKAIIFGGELGKAVEEVAQSMPGVALYHSGLLVDEQSAERVGSLPSSSLDSAMQSTSAFDPKPIKEIKLKDRMLLIYTSGTTGLPKPAVITHLRYIFIATSVRCAYRILPEDVLYDPLPLYHSAGVALGLGQAIVYGTTAVIRRKFSASRFWDDCIKHNCTVSQYIGEICRYLLTQPERPQDRMHSVRLMYGNGLRPQNWTNFVQRFGIKQMREFYGATEGNSNLSNLDNRVGAIGFLSRIVTFAYPVMLIKVDINGEPIRNSRGWFIRSEPGEPGELIGKICCKNPMRAFDGYVDATSTRKKIANDVFSKGDMYFLTGDLMVMDHLGYLYFVDRCGDTFRWKGENVSTTEVEGVISELVGLRDCVVYGVEVPGAEGRAGMAAVVDQHDHHVAPLDLEHLAKASANCLPAYSRPLFLRVVDSLPMTGTFKMKKVDLQKEGFNPSECLDGRLYYLNNGRYSTLDEDTYAAICSGKIRV